MFGENISVIEELLKLELNPFMVNGTSHRYQLEHSISLLRDVGGIFHFYSNFNRTFCNQTVETLIRRRILRRLVWVCTVCICPTKRTLGLCGLKTWV